MTNNRSHTKTSLKWNKDGDLESGDMLLILERLKNKDLISCSLTEKKISSYSKFKINSEDFMNKRIPYTIIPYFFNNIYEREPIAKIKVIFWKLKCEDNPALFGCEIN